jgi:hypothetical protein
VGSETLKFLRSTLQWLEEHEQDPDPMFDAESVAELKEILLSRIAKYEREGAVLVEPSATSSERHLDGE